MYFFLILGYIKNEIKRKYRTLLQCWWKMIYHIFYFYFVVAELPPLKLKHPFCGFKADDGPCKAMLKRFFFNIHTQQCEEFIYGGCEGNQNRFESLEECKEKCARGTFLAAFISQEPLGLLELIIDLIILRKKISANYFYTWRHLSFTFSHIFGVCFQLFIFYFFHISLYKVY